MSSQRAQVVRLSTIVGLVLIFGAITEKIWFKEGLTWDVPITLVIYGWRQPWMDRLMALISQTGAGGAGGLMIGVGLWFWRRRQWVNIVTLLLGFVGAVTLDSVLTFLFERPRPALLSPLVVATSYDFPSGRTIVATIVYGMLIVFLWRKQHANWALIGSAWVIIVAISQIYRGQHPPSDVLASLSISLLWLFAIFPLSHWLVRCKQNQRNEPR